MMFDVALLKEYRLSKCLSVAQAGEILGIARTSYFKKESGLRKFTVDEVAVLINAFGLSTDEVYELFRKSE